MRMNLRRLLLPLLAVCSLLLVACGDDGATDDAGADEPTDTVVIEHAYGTTELDEVPERIVSLNTQWLGALQALDVEPVGYNVDTLAGPDGVFPWEEVPEGAEAIETSDGLPLEQIAALDPDLILVTYMVTDQETYDQLNAIAPTIGALGDRQVDTWQEMTTTLGEVLRDPDAAAAVIDDVEGQLAAVAEELPGLDGQTFGFANYVPGDSIYVVSDPDDGSSLFFQSLGMEIAPSILDAGDGVVGRVQLSFEQVDVLDADLLVMFTNSGDPSDLPGYDNLPAVQAGSVALPDYAEIVGLNTPSPLSIPYSLEAVRPALEAAAES
jgi:iron complex transport system substrate-binding protein